MRLFFLLLLALNIMPPSSLAKPIPELIAHRGASFDAPENTLAAVEEALRQRADGVEIDIHQTKDGKLVVMHDVSLLRTSFSPFYVKELSWQQLQYLDVGAWKARQFNGEAIPLLEAVLQQLPADRTLFIEIKGAEGTLVPNLVRLLAKYEGRRATTIIIGFKLAQINLFKSLLPTWKAYYLFENNYEIASGLVDFQSLINEALAHQVDGIDLEYAGAQTERHIAQIKASGLDAAIWTGKDDDTLATARHCMQTPLDYYTTNHPGLIRRKLDIK